MQTRSYKFNQLRGNGSGLAPLRLHTILGAIALFGACGIEELDTSEQVSAATVSSFITSSCTTAVVRGLAIQISDEVSCMSPSSLVRFAAGSGVTFTSNAVLPFLAANAKTDLLAVGNVQLNSAFRTVPQQFLILQWFHQGRCGITAAAAVGRSNHESGRAVDLANASARVTAMANHHWSHDVPGDPVHFDHLTSSDIRGRDTLAFQRLWNRNNPADKIAEDGDFGPITEARLRKSPATGFAKGASCAAAARVRGSEVVAIDGPDRVAPGATARYQITLSNTSDTDWPATTTLTVADGTPSELYDAASWTSGVEVGPIGVTIPAGSQGIVAVDIVAPDVTTQTVVAADLALIDGAAQVGTIALATTVTPNGNENTSSESDDQADDGQADDGQANDDQATGGCSAASGAGWLALAPVLLVLRRRRRN